MLGDTYGDQKQVKAQKKGQVDFTQCEGGVEITEWCHEADLSWYFGS